jgi:hypothetical protein
MAVKTSATLPGMLGLGAGILLFVSPLLLDFTGAAAMTAHILGILAVAAKLKPLVRPNGWDMWLVAAIGALAFLAPWVLGFASAAVAAWTHMALGLVVGASAPWAVTFKMGGRGTAPAEGTGGKPGGPAEVS